MLMLMPSDAGAVAVADDAAAVVVVVVVVVVDNEVLSRNCCEGWSVGLCSVGAEGISTKKRYLRRRMVEFNFDLIDKFRCVSSISI